MAVIKQAEIGTVGLIQELPDGRIIQLGMNQEQFDTLQLFVAALSRDNPFVKIAGDNELIPKHTVKQP